jgi:hypothetical protein
MQLALGVVLPYSMLMYAQTPEPAAPPADFRSHFRYPAAEYFDG